MKFISWNVNGIRAVLKKGFMEFFESNDFDFLCLQETRAPLAEAPLNLPGYHIYWNEAEKKGYSGTAIITKQKALSEAYKMGISKHDKEGRTITLEYKDFFLVNVYVPNAGRDLSRLDYRVGEWNVDFLNYLKTLEKKKPVIFCGDLNVAHKEIDLARPKPNRGNSGFTDQERAGFDNIVNAGFVDTFRHFNQDSGHYSWWSYMGRARDKNIGWRIDYFCVSPSLAPRLVEAGILPHVQGSDHCPVTLNLR